MTATVDLLMILTFLSALYTLLGLLCAVAERVQDASRRYRRGRAPGALRRSRVRPRRAKAMLPRDRRTAPAFDALHQGTG